MIDGRVVWYNSVRRDLWFNIVNQHDILGIFGAVRFHPYSRRERIIITWATLGFTFFITTALTLDFDCDSMVARNEPQDKIDRCRRDKARDGEFMQNLFVSLVVAIYSTLFGSFIRLSAECLCVQGCSIRVRECMEGLGHVWMGLMTLVGLLGFIGGSDLLSRSDKDAQSVLITFVLAAAESELYQIVIISAFFFYRRKKEIAKYNEDTYPKMIPSYNQEFLRDQGDATSKDTKGLPGASSSAVEIQNKAGDPDEEATGVIPPSEE